MFLLEYDSYDHSPRSYPYGCLLEELCPNLPFFFSLFFFVSFMWMDVECRIQRCKQACQVLRLNIMAAWDKYISVHPSHLRVYIQT